MVVTETAKTRGMGTAMVKKTALMAWQLSNNVLQSVPELVHLESGAPHTQPPAVQTTIAMCAVMMHRTVHQTVAPPSRHLVN